VRFPQANGNQKAGLRQRTEPQAWPRQVPHQKRFQVEEQQDKATAAHSREHRLEGERHRELGRHQKVPDCVPG